jgi:hypothetical protein
MYPVTVVLADGKSWSLCIHARKVKRGIIPDRECKALLNELLKEFHSASYVTPIDLSQAFR